MMQMEQVEKDPMKDALLKKRGMAVTIILGGPESEGQEMEMQPMEANKDSDLAPDVKEEMGLEQPVSMAKGKPELSEEDLASLSGKLGQRVRDGLKK